MTGPTTDPSATDARSRRFAADPHPRFWWHKLHGTDYVPPIYDVLSDAEWDLMERWYAETEQRDSIGEINVPAMSLIQGLIGGNGLSRVVQLGHYYGYSTLLIGFWLRRMNQGGKLVTIDIDPVATGFTDYWVGEAGLRDFVELRLCDSAGPQAIPESRNAFDGRMPELILLDSSHQYAHTIRELDLWVPEMDPQTIMLLHDTSTYARSWDQDGKGGVQKALDDWVPKHTKDVAFLNLNRRVGEPGVSDELTYRDGVGLGILQKL
jgi:predicted O-methyltransferase YrrM